MAGENGYGATILTVASIVDHTIQTAKQANGLSNQGLRREAQSWRSGRAELEGMVGKGQGQEPGGTHSASAASLAGEERGGQRLGWPEPRYSYHLRNRRAGDRDPEKGNRDMGTG